MLVSPVNWAKILTSHCREVLSVNKPNTRILQNVILLGVLAATSDSFYSQIQEDIITLFQFLAWP